MVLTWQQFSNLFYFPAFLIKSEHVSNPMELINTFVIVFWSFASIFFFCAFGEMVTHQFNVFDDELCQCDWYLFPIEMKRMMIIFMVNTQQPAIIQGFANTVCTREAFKKVKKHILKSFSCNAFL